jgi:hypothetical protein
MEKRLFFDTEKHQYLTSKVNSLFSLKLDFIRTSEDIKEKLPIKNDEESSIVDKRFEISNLLRDITEVTKMSD